MNSYNVIFRAGNGMVGNQFISSDANLLDKFKNAKLMDEDWLVWDTGALKVSEILGIIDTTFRPKEG